MKKKLFISCPMKNRTEENIKKSMEKMHKIAEAVFGEQLEVLDTYFETTPDVKDSGLWCLGKSIELMSDANYFIGVDAQGRQAYRGCSIENQIAIVYGLEMFEIDLKHFITDDEYIEKWTRIIYAKDDKK